MFVLSYNRYDILLGSALLINIIADYNTMQTINVKFLYILELTSPYNYVVKTLTTREVSLLQLEQIRGTFCFYSYISI